MSQKLALLALVASAATLASAQANWYAQPFAAPDAYPYADEDESEYLSEESVDAVKKVILHPVVLDEVEAALIEREQEKREAAAYEAAAAAAAAVR